MTDTTVPLDVDAIRARVEAATEGPWEQQFREASEQHSAGFYIMADIGMLGSVTTYKAATIRTLTEATGDAEFIAHARTDIPALLDEVERLRSLLGEEEWEYGVRWGEDGTHNLSGTRERALERMDLRFGDQLVRRRRQKIIDSSEWVVVPHE